MKILYFGDVYSKPGRDAVKKAITQLVPLHEIDFVVINGENVAHGHGITPEMAEEMFEAGVDVITTGNHAWDQKQIIPYMSQTTRLIRPLNYPQVAAYPTPGRGSTVVDSKRSRKTADGRPFKLGVIQVMGRVFMDALDCPFQAAEREAERLNNVGVDCLLVDFHGEATSEKQAFSFYMDGKVSAVVGSHSHVQTADERVLVGGTAAITDVGMCGNYDSVIGVKKEISIQRFLSKRPIRYEAAEGPGGYGCVVIDIDEKTGKSRSILRLRETTI